MESKDPLALELTLFLAERAIVSMAMMHDPSACRGVL